MDNKHTYMTMKKVAVLGMLAVAACAEAKEPVDYVDRKSVV